MAHRTFEVDDIHCDGCSRTIRNALSDVGGVQDVRPESRTNQVAVTYDDQQVDEQTIAQVLADAGFPVQRTLTDDQTAEAGGADADDGQRSWSRYALLTAGVLVVALAGYAGYELYPRFDLPALEGAGLLVLAAGAGIASFFAPCSFPLLVTLLSRQAGRSDEGEGRPAVFAAALAGGAALFLVVLGALIALGGSAFAAGVTFTSTVGITLRIIVGTALIVLGLVQLGVLADSPFRTVERVTKRLNRKQAKLRRQHPVAGFTAFGFFYLAAGFG
ncbi:cation transporter [Euzebya sp.]|uniref:cation transporter n=1 Tax=Euzebya sp. TaxID=1971409 RepID=UPI003516FA05